MRKYLLIALIMVDTIVAKESRLVNIAQGPVRGYKEPGEDVFVFYGIPYATAPSGIQKYKVVGLGSQRPSGWVPPQLLFQPPNSSVQTLLCSGLKGAVASVITGAPLPPPSWTEPFEAINRNITCPQMQAPGITVPNAIQLEDCLIANVYVPDVKQDKLPVLVHVHGGGYQIGQGEFITPKNLIKEYPMVVVNFNYRLGPLGFLCLGTPDVPGNAGMKDQVALLRWVKKNIANFGGNPDDVTISGYSAGSASVDLLILSPMTQGLFNKVIPESGASLSVFSVQIDPIENAKKYAKMLNFTGNGDDVYALEDFYKSVSGHILHSINLWIAKDTVMFFTPCIERDLGEERFLDDAPINILKNGRQQKLPMLYGLTEMEGLIRIPFYDLWKDDMNKKFSDFLPGDLRFDSEAEKEEVAQKVKKYYFGQRSIGNETILRYIDYFTDVIFVYSSLTSVRLQVASGNNNIYLYEYRFVDESAPLIPYTVVRGAEHCAQTFGVLDGGSFLNYDEENLSNDYKNVKKLIRKLWATFITTGKPVPEGSDLPYWPPTQANGGPHMSIDKTLKLRGPLLQHRVLFWEEIYNKYYSIPSPPAPYSRQRNEL